MNKYNYKLIVLSISFPAYISYALASEEDSDYSIQPLVGGFLGYHSIDNRSTMESDFNYSVVGGLRFNPHWSWMIKYQFSEHTTFDKDKYDVDLGIVSNTLRYEWYIKPDISFMTGLGAAYWYEEDSSGDILTTAKGFSPVATVGLNYYYQPKLSFQGAYQYIADIGESNHTRFDMHNFVFGMVYQYGQGKSATIPIPEPKPTIEPASTPKLPIIPILDNSELIASLHFNFDSAIIIENVDSLLQQIQDKLEHYPDSHLQITGHTDSIGNDKYNERLSYRRAETLAALLQANGVDESRIKVSAKGSREPVATNSTREGRAENRRIEVILNP